MLNELPQKSECEEPWKIMEPLPAAVPDPQMDACAGPITADPPVSAIVTEPRESDPDVRERVYPLRRTPVTVKVMTPAA